MKYFTKEELEDITSELLENPTRETLKNLNQKYNGSTEPEEVLTKVPDTNIEPPVMKVIPNLELEKKQVVEPISPNVDVNSSFSPIPNLNVPNLEIPETETISSNSYINSNNQNFELPKLETPTFNNQNNQPVNFNGNLWDQPQSNMENLMQTTDNFASTTNVVPNTEVPVTGAPFFGPNQEQVNNPIPVGGSSPSGPTMFGQFEQNYM